MKEVQSINNYPICDAQARAELENKANKYHEHEEYATKTYVNTLINNLDIDDFDTSDFVTKDELEDALRDLDLDNYVTEDELNDALDDMRDYINNQIAEADPNIDLSDYALKTDIPTRVSELENDAEYISYYDICLKDENGDYVVDENGNYIIEDHVTEREMEKYVDDALANYATKDYVDSLFNSIQAQINNIYSILDELENNQQQPPVTPPEDDGGDDEDNKTQQEIWFSYIDGNNVASGSAHTSLVKEDGTGWACGANTSGCLGIGKTQGELSVVGSFTQIKAGSAFPTDIKCMASGQSHSILIKKDGSVWGAGVSDYGQLGDISSFSTTAFTGLNLNNAVFCACGDNHSVVIKNDGTVWTCGRNHRGQCGVGSTESVFSWKQVTGISKAIYAVCSKDSTAVLTENGSLYVCGSNNYGGLGFGDRMDRQSFNRLTTNVARFGLGTDHILILKNDGTLWSGGDTWFGQLGTGHGMEAHNVYALEEINMTGYIGDRGKIIDVACGAYHSMALFEDGTVMACGSNLSGERGYVITNNNNSDDFRDFPNAFDIVRIYNSAGQSTFMVDVEGTIWACGQDDHDQLGLGASGSHVAMLTATSHITLE